MPSVVEETLPDGYEVSGISDDGEFANGIVRWGPFFDDAPRTLRYALTPEAEVVEGTFSGMVNFDGATEVTIGGEQAVEGGSGDEPVRIVGIELVEGGGVKLTIESSAGIELEVEASSDLSSWEPIASVGSGAGTVEFLTDRGEETVRSYRVRR